MMPKWTNSDKWVTSVTQKFSKSNKSQEKLITYNDLKVVEIPSNTFAARYISLGAFEM